MPAVFVSYRNKMSSDWEQARKDYQRVLALQPSYYMADNVGQMSVRLGDRDRARQVYLQARSYIAERKEKSFWAFATLANAAVVIGDEPELPHLEAVLRASPRPSAHDLASIREGLEHLGIGLRSPS